MFKKVVLIPLALFGILSVIIAIPSETTLNAKAALCYACIGTIGSILLSKCFRSKTQLVPFFEATVGELYYVTQSGYQVGSFYAFIVSRVHPTPVLYRIKHEHIGGIHDPGLYVFVFENGTHFWRSKYNLFQLEVRSTDEREAVSIYAFFRTSDNNIIVLVGSGGLKEWRLIVNGDVEDPPRLPARLFYCTHGAEGAGLTWVSYPSFMA